MELARRGSSFLNIVSLRYQLCLLRESSPAPLLMRLPDCQTGTGAARAIKASLFWITNCTVSQTCVASKELNIISLVESVNKMNLLMKLFFKFVFSFNLNDIRRYSPLRGLTSSSCEGLWPLAEVFFALRSTTKIPHSGNTRPSHTGVA